MSVITSNKKTREDMANPFRHIPHSELLKLAKVGDLRDNYRVIELPNGYIRVEPIDPTKVYK